MALIQAHRHPNIEREHSARARRRGQSLVEYVLLCAMVTGSFMFIKNVWLGGLADLANKEGESFKADGWRATPANVPPKLEYHYQSGVSGADKAVIDVQ